MKNYASTSSLPNIFAAIEKTLSTHGATEITRNYQNGVITAISFVVNTKTGPLKIKLPAKTDKVRQLFENEGRRYKEDQPYRTAWATIRDWVAAQMALLDWEMVKMEEIFLPYAVDKDGRTFFEVIENKGFLLGGGE